MKAVTGGGPSPLTASNVSARHRCLTGDGIPYNPSKVRIRLIFVPDIIRACIRIRYYPYPSRFRL
uniref:Uncharacterized protein n=1 Tax=Oryza sativa subsp. japonica TaxID=39947 RepID=Q7EZW0_ORYSJ|nr:hypothetical protein [Oryza sativa Japonica Group]BAD33851.1 hypothetical protein [Oryza sativa Japonica Group]